MFKIFIGVLIGLALVTPTGQKVVKMEWNHLKQLTSTVVNGVTR